MKTLKIAFRNLLKNKVVSTINLVGLTLGVVISLLLLAYVQQEKNTDKFIPEYDNIYMLTANGESPISKPMVQFIKNNVPDLPITYFSQNWAEQVYLSDEEQNKYKIPKLLDVDEHFFKVFQFEALYGNLQEALNSSNKIVLSEKLAKKIFGNKNPVGKSLHYNTTYLDGEMVEVAAVLKTLPENTAWKYDAFLSIETNNKISWYKGNADRWGTQNYSAFCKISPKRFSAIEQQTQALGNRPEVKENFGGSLSWGFSPYADNYLYFQKSWALKHNNPQTLGVLQLIALLILLMATINYVNLVSAQRQKRNKSVAIIKMLGSQKWGVVQLFMAEAGLLLIGVLLLFFMISPFAIESLNSLMNTHYTTALLWSGSGIALLLGILIFTFTVTGIIPGLIFSRHQALKLLKPDMSKQKASLFRNALPITQFAVSIALLICLFAMKKQNDMMLNQNPGFQKEHIVFASTNRDIQKNTQSFTNELKRISGISEIAFADAAIGNIGQNWGTYYTYKGEKKHIGFTKIGVSANYFDFFGLKLKKGQLFKDDKNSSQFIMNESVVKQYGIEDLEDVKLDIGNDTKVVGVVEDFNFKSAHNAIMPLAFAYEGDMNTHVFFKLNTTNYTELKNTMAQVEQLWNKLSPNLPLEYEFMDESWNALYKKELQFQKVLNYAGLVSILIAALGLFGLSIFVAERRTKEIGIRKVNGATVTEVLTLLNRDFVKWVIIAFVIATPIAYYAMNKWLESFAYKTSLSWWIFALAGLSALVIALLTVSWQSWRTARRNPVEALRYE